MGRASRTKREKRAQDVSVLYRFFTEAAHADAFVEGNIKLSTLEACRKHENSEQGDAEEAIHRYNSGHIVGSSGDVDYSLIASRCGVVDLGYNKNTVISNNTVIELIPDAFVLCTTKEYDPDTMRVAFGSYCVEITDINRLYQLVTRALSKKYSIQNAQYGHVLYKERSYVGIQEPPGPIGFVKPAYKYTYKKIISYKDQKEFRFLWTLINNNTNLEPFILENVPKISEFCRRIA